ncbi:MAG: ATP-binding protein [Candidatus Bipolaricaulis sp.]|nr:ATP-binding protein [Candidatus Bipolaricaulis sp.]
MGARLNISHDLDLDLEKVIGQCIAVLGIRGSGKSNTAGVIFEELLNQQYPMSIVDIEGEYFGLKEKYEVLVVGTGEGVEIEIDAGCAAEIAEVSMEQNVPVVLDLSGFLSDERTELLKEYLGALWNLAGKLRRPYIIGIEEAHEFIPQGVKTELKELIARIALRGRKRGLGAIVVSQRSAKVDKDVLSQAGMLLLHRVVHEVDMRVYGELLPWRKSEVKEIITSLETGHCIFVNGDVVQPIYVRERATFHAGFTPTLDAVAPPALKQVSASIIEAIERAREGKGRRSKTQELELQLARLEEKLGEKDARIVELEDVARTLGYIKVEVPAGPPSALAAGPPSALAAGAPSALAASVAWIGTPETPAVQSLPHLIGVTRRSRRGDALAARRSTAPENGWGILDVAEEESPDALPPAVARHVERLVARIERQSPLHRRVLAFLVAHAPDAYTAEQISAWTHCARALIEDEPPADLLETGLVERERRTDGIRYRSRLKSFVTAEFGVYQPDIGEQGLHEVARRLRERLGTA